MWNNYRWMKKIGEDSGCLRKYYNFATALKP